MGVGEENDRPEREEADAGRAVEHQQEIRGPIRAVAWRDVEQTVARRSKAEGLQTERTVLGGLPGAGEESASSLGVGQRSRIVAAATGAAGAAARPGTAPPRKRQRRDPRGYARPRKDSGPD